MRAVRHGRPGASEAALDEVEERIGQTLPAALRALYRIHDGQTYDASTPPLHGLFGWWVVFWAVANVGCVWLLLCAKSLNACRLLAGSACTATCTAPSCTL